MIRHTMRIALIVTQTVMAAAFFYTSFTTCSGCTPERASRVAALGMLMACACLATGAFLLLGERHDGE